MFPSQNPQDFWDAFNFWIFFAVGHPLLQPILWISDVLHGSPGPIVFDLVPASFLMANILFIGATAWSKEVRHHFFGMHLYQCMSPINLALTPWIFELYSFVEH